MSKSDFYVSFDSNSDTFVDKIRTDLANAETVIRGFDTSIRTLRGMGSELVGEAETLAKIVKGMQDRMPNGAVKVEVESVGAASGQDVAALAAAVRELAAAAARNAPAALDHERRSRQAAESKGAGGKFEHIPDATNRPPVVLGTGVTGEVKATGVREAIKEGTKATRDVRKSVDGVKKAIQDLANRIATGAPAPAAHKAPPAPATKAPAPAATASPSAAPAVTDQVATLRAAIAANPGKRKALEGVLTELTTLAATMGDDSVSAQDRVDRINNLTQQVARLTRTPAERKAAKQAARRIPRALTESMTPGATDIDQALVNLKIGMHLGVGTDSDFEAGFKARKGSAGAIANPKEVLKSIIESYSQAGVGPDQVLTGDLATLWRKQLWNSGTGTWKATSDRASVDSYLSIVKELGHQLRSQRRVDVPEGLQASDPTRFTFLKALNRQLRRQGAVPDEVDPRLAEIMGRFDTTMPAEVESAFDRLGLNYYSGGYAGTYVPMTRPAGKGKIGQKAKWWTRGGAILDGENFDQVPAEQKAVVTAWARDMRERALREVFSDLMSRHVTGLREGEEFNPYQLSSTLVKGSGAQAKAARRGLAQLRAATDYLDLRPERYLRLGDQASEFEDQADQHRAARDREQAAREAEKVAGSPEQRAQMWLRELGRTPVDHRKRAREHRRLANKFDREAELRRTEAEALRAQESLTDPELFTPEYLTGVRRRMGWRADYAEQLTQAQLEQRTVGQNFAAVRGALRDAMLGNRYMPGLTENRESGELEFAPALAGEVRAAAKRRAKSRFGATGPKELRRAEKSLLAPLNKARNALVAFVADPERVEVKLPKPVREGLTEVAGLVDKIAKGKKLNGAEDDLLGSTARFLRMTKEDFAAQAGADPQALMARTRSQTNLGYLAHRYYSAYDDAMGYHGLRMRSGEDVGFSVPTVRVAAPGGFTFKEASSVELTRRLEAEKRRERELRERQAAKNAEYRAAGLHLRSVDGVTQRDLQTSDAQAVLARPIAERPAFYYERHERTVALDALERLRRLRDKRQASLGAIDVAAGKGVSPEGVFATFMRGQALGYEDEAAPILKRLLDSDRLKYVGLPGREPTQAERDAEAAYQGAQAEREVAARKVAGYAADPMQHMVQRLEELGVRLEHNPSMQEATTPEALYTAFDKLRASGQLILSDHSVPKQQVASGEATAATNRPLSGEERNAIAKRLGVHLDRAGNVMRTTDMSDEVLTEVRRRHGENGRIVDDEYARAAQQYRDEVSARERAKVTTEQGPVVLGTLDVVRARQQVFRAKHDIAEPVLTAAPAEQAATAATQAATKATQAAAKATTEAAQAAEGAAAATADVAEVAQGGRRFGRASRGAQPTGGSAAGDLRAALSGMRLDRDDDVAAIERVVAAVNSVHALIGRGLRISAMPARRGAAGSEGDARTESRQRTAARPSTAQRQQYFDHATQEALFTRLGEARPALGERSREAIRARSREEALVVASAAVQEGLLRARDAANLFADGLGLDTQEASAFRIAMQQAQRAARTNARLDRTVAEGVRARGAQERIELTTRQRVAPLGSEVVEEARRIGELMGRAEGEAMQQEVIRRQVELYRRVEAMSRQQGVTRRGDVNRNFRDVLRAGGMQLPDSEMRNLTRHVAALEQESRPAAERAGRGTGGYFGASMSEGFMAEASRRLFGSHGFWSRVMNSAGLFMVRNFAAGMVFGLTSALQEVIATALETESTFIRVSHALEATGRSAGGLRVDLLKISTDYGVSLRDVYKTAAGMTGVFKDVKSIAGATRIVTELQMISDGALNAAEGMSALSSVSAAYGTYDLQSLEHVADVMTVIQNSLGTNIEVSIEGVGAIAGLANQLGLGMEEAAVYVAQIAKMTNQTGAAAGEQFSRILAVMQTGRGQSSLRQALGGRGMNAALDSRDYSQALRILMANYKSLTKAQQDNIATTLGGQRQMKAMAALLLDGARVLDTVEQAENAHGEAAQRAARIAEQLNNQIKKLGTNLQALASELLHAGVLDVLGVALKVINATLSFTAERLAGINAVFDANPILSGFRHMTMAALGFVAALRIIRAVAGSAGASLRQMGQFVREQGARVGLGVGTSAALGATEGAAGSAAGSAAGAAAMRRSWVNRRLDRWMTRATMAAEAGVSYRAAGQLPAYRALRATERPPVEPNLLQRSATRWTDRAAEAAARRQSLILAATGGATSLTASVQRTFDSREATRALGRVESNSLRMARALNVAGNGMAFVSNNLGVLAAAGVGIGLVLSSIAAENAKQADRVKSAMAEYDTATGSNYFHTQDVDQSDPSKGSISLGQFFGATMRAGRFRVPGLRGFRGEWDRATGDISDTPWGGRDGELGTSDTSFGQRNTQMLRTLQKGGLSVGGVVAAQNEIQEQYLTDLKAIIEDPSLSDAQRNRAVAVLKEVKEVLVGQANDLLSMAKGAGKAGIASLDILEQVTGLQSQVANLDPGEVQRVAGVMVTQLHDLGIAEGSKAYQAAFQGLGLGMGVTVTDPALDDLTSRLRPRTSNAGEARAMATRLGRTNDLGGPGRSVSVEALTRQQHLRNQRDWARQNVEDATNVYTTTLATGTTEDKERARNALFAAIQVKTQAEQAYIEQVASDAQAEAEWLRSMGQYEGSAGALEDAAKQVQDAAKAYKTKDPGRYASEMARARAMLRQAAEDRATPDRSASAIRESKAWGSEARAAEAARRAREEYANRSSHPNAYTQEEIDQAQAEVYNTARSQTEAAQSRVQAGYELKAATTLNSVAKARIQLAAAQQAYSFALQHYSAGSAEALAALTQLQMAMQSVADAQFAQNEAIRQTRVARIAPSNAVAIAKMQVRNARASMHEAARFGRSSVEYQGALQQELQAEWQLIAARQAVTQARIGLRQAQAQAAGDSVKAAQVGVQLAKAQLAAAKRNSGGRTTADVLNARASLVTARAAARDAKLQYELDTIDFNKEMGNITGQEAVRALQAMLKATNLTEQQRRDIMRKIKGLQDDIRQQLTGSGFNIPGEISLPTAYEVRRSLAVDSARQAITRSVTDVRKAADLQASSLQVTSRSADAALIDQLKAVRDAVLAKGSQQVTQDVQIVQNVPSSALVKQIATQVIDELRRMASSAQRANTSTPRSIRN